MKKNGLKLEDTDNMILDEKEVMEDLEDSIENANIEHNSQIQEDLVDQLEDFQDQLLEEDEDDDEDDLGSDLEEMETGYEETESNIVSEKENKKPLDISKDTEKMLDTSGSQARLSSSERSRDSLVNIGIVGTGLSSGNILNKDYSSMDIDKKHSNKMDKHGRPPIPERVDRFNERDYQPQSHKRTELSPKGETEGKKKKAKDKRSVERKEAKIPGTNISRDQMKNVTENV